jgi:hypothetical protein
MYPVLRDKNLTVSLFALGLHKGRKPETASPLVIIGMHFLATKGEVSPQNRELLALADGESIDFGIAQRMQIDGIKDDERSAAYGSLAAYSDVRTFAEAKTAEFRFFGVTGKLPRDAQQALDAFVKRLRP